MLPQLYILHKTGDTVEVLPLLLLDSAASHLTHSIADDYLALYCVLGRLSISIHRQLGVPRLYRAGLSLLDGLGGRRCSNCTLHGLLLLLFQKSHGKAKDAAADCAVSKSQLSHAIKLGNLIVRT